MFEIKSLGKIAPSVIKGAEPKYVEYLDYPLEAKEFFVKIDSYWHVLKNPQMVYTDNGIPKLMIIVQPEELEYGWSKIKVSSKED